MRLINGKFYLFKVDRSHFYVDNNVYYRAILQDILQAVLETHLPDTPDTRNAYRLRNEPIWNHT
jgi:hypothetical protein